MGILKFIRGLFVGKKKKKVYVSEFIEGDAGIDLEKVYKEFPEKTISPPTTIPQNNTALTTPLYPKELLLPDQPINKNIIGNSRLTHKQAKEKHNRRAKNKAARVARKIMRGK